MTSKMISNVVRWGCLCLGCCLAGCSENSHKPPTSRLVEATPQFAFMDKVMGIAEMEIVSKVPNTKFTVHDCETADIQHQLTCYGPSAWIRWPNARRLVIEATSPGYEPKIAALTEPQPRYDCTPDVKVMMVREPANGYQPRIEHREEPLPQVAERFALIVGISQYQHADPKNGFDNLHYAAADAREVKNALLRRHWKEDHIRLLVDADATKENVEDAFGDFLMKAGQNDLVLLFWSGHGYPARDPANPGRAYFACYDSDIKKKTKGLEMDVVAYKLKSRHTRNVVVLADACHAGAIIPENEKGEKEFGIEPWIDKQSPPSGWVFMAAAHRDLRSLEDRAWEHGAFTKCLLSALGKGGKEPVTIGELTISLEQQMPKITRDVFGVPRYPVIKKSDAMLDKLEIDEPVTGSARQP